MKFVLTKKCCQNMHMYVCICIYICILIYKALCFDMAQGRMNGAPNETRTHSCRFASLAC